MPATAATAVPGGRRREMGTVTARIEVVNAYDEARQRHGELPAHAVRRLALTGVLVDTGANMLCLPARMIEQLGLDLVREVRVLTATGPVIARVFGDVHLTVEGRSAPFECMELPGGREPLLGVLPLETLGIELDLQRQRLVLLPDQDDQTYLTIL